MLVFLSLFLKFYLADTPHRRNILVVGSEQLRVINEKVKDLETRGSVKFFRTLPLICGSVLQV